MYIYIMSNTIQRLSYLKFKPLNKIDYNFSVSSLDVSGLTLLKGGVGIGKSSASHPLDVSGNAVVSGNTSVGGNTFVSGNVGIGKNSASHPLDVSGNAHISKDLQVTENAVVSGNTSVGGNTFVSGNVGIGKNSASQPLDVSGNAHISKDLQVTENAVVSGNTSVGGNTFVSGNVGIGKSSASHPLDVSGNAHISKDLDVSGNSSITKSLQVTENVLVSGNLGIGTNSPTYPLDVYGDTRIKGLNYNDYSNVFKYNEPTLVPPILSTGIANGIFGYGIFFSSDGLTLAVGSPGENNDYGKVRVYTRPSITYTGWPSVYEINGSVYGKIGFSISLSKNGLTLAISAPYTSSNTGRVYIYSRTTNTSNEWNYDTQIDGFSNSFFGCSLSLSEDGLILAIGSPYENNDNGAVRIYNRDNNTSTIWNLISTLQTGISSARFGYMLELSRDGLTLAVGSIAENNYMGVVRLYMRNSTNDDWFPPYKFSNNLNSSFFGNSISFSNDSLIMAIGAPQTNTAYVYTRPNKTYFNVDENGNSIGLNARYLRFEYGVGNNGVGRGMNLAGVKVYTSLGGTNIINSSMNTSSLDTNVSNLYTSNKMVDNDDNTIYHSHGSSEYPWVEVDLGSDTFIHRLELINRVECCRERANGIVLKLKDTNGNVIYTSNPIVNKNGSSVYQVDDLPYGYFSYTFWPGVNTNVYPSDTLPYVLTSNDTNWSLPRIFSNNISGSLYGHHVSFSGDGLNMAISSPDEKDINNNYAGAVRIYKRTSATSNIWLDSVDVISSEGYGRFGTNMSFSDVGLLAIAKSYETIDVNSNAGSVSIYKMNDEYVLINPSNNSLFNRLEYSLISMLDNDTAENAFGQRSKISNDGLTLVVSAPRYDSYRGIVYTYTRNNTTESFNNYSYIGSPNGGVFGFRAIQLSSDSLTLAVAAIYEPPSGAVYIYTRNTNTSTTWIFNKKLQSNVANTQFGSDLSLSSDGLTLVVSSWMENTNVTMGGVVRIYMRTSSTSSDWSVNPVVIIENDAYFLGIATQLSNDGLTLVVGSLENYVASSNPWSYEGAVRIYTRPNSTSTEWSSPIYLNTGIKVGGVVEYSSIGHGLALSSDSLTLAISTPTEDTRKGVVRIYSRTISTSTVWNEVYKIQGNVNEGYFGWTLTLSSNGLILAIAAPREGSGVIYIYKRPNTNSSVWKFVDKIIPPSNINSDARFGESISFTGDNKTIAIGSLEETVRGKTSAGALRVYDITIYENELSYPLNIDGNTNMKGVLNINSGVSGKSLLLGYNNELDTALINVENNSNLSLQSRGGNVGIGNTNPTHPLDVNGNAHISKDLQVTKNALISGNVGIGTNNPQVQLDLRGNGIVGNIMSIHRNDTNFPGQYLFFNTNGSLGYYDANSIKVTWFIDNSGNINSLGNAHIFGQPGEGTTLYLGGGGSGDYGYDHSVIETRVWGNSDQTEMLLFKGNDGPSGVVGSDRIRLKAGEIRFDTYNNHSTDRTSETTKMIIGSNGYVGIGTTTPGRKFESRSGNGYDGQSSEGNWISGVFGPSVVGPRVVLGTLTNIPVIGGHTNDLGAWNNIAINPYGGCVGIGTTGPNFPLHIEGSNSPYIMSNTQWLYQGTSIGGLNWYGLPNIGLYCWGAIASSSYVNYSDKRIKENIVDIDDNNALSKLRLLKPKTYDYVDKLSRGDDNVIGFIAQEVREVLPRAVSLIKDYVPNFNTRCKISLTDISNVAIVETEMDLSWIPLHDISRNSYVDASGNACSDAFGNKHFKIKLYDTSNNVIKVDTKNIIDKRSFLIELKDSKLLDRNGNFIGNSGSYVDGSGNTINYENLYLLNGQEVDDFHTLDKGAIFTVATAALQEVDRQQQADKLRISSLENEVSLLKQVNTTMINEIDVLKQVNTTMTNEIDVLKQVNNSLIERLNKLEEIINDKKCIATI